MAEYTEEEIQKAIEEWKAKEAEILAAKEEETPKVEDVVVEEPKNEIAEIKEEVKMSDIINSVKADKDIHFELDKTKDVSDQASDLVDLAATTKAVEDEELVENITELKKQELYSNAEDKLKKKTVESKKTEKELQEANYGVYSGIADLIGLKKALPNAMLKALMVVLMPLLIVYYSVVGFFTGLINITMDCVNAVVERFATFTKSAKKVIGFVLITILSALVILVVLWLLRTYTGVFNKNI